MDNQKRKMKPKFKRQQLILNKLKDSWRKPKGIHSKLRLQKKGKGKLVRIGYGTKKDLKGLIKGKKAVRVTNLKDLENLKEAIIISSKIGLKKKLEIINKAKELKLEIINIKNVDKFLEEIKKNKEEKKKLKEEKKKKKIKKEEKSKEKETKEESKGKKEEENSEEKEKKLKEDKKKVLEKGL